jgi:hypothetical protein
MAKKSMGQDVFDTIAYLTTSRLCRKDAGQHTEEELKQMTVGLFDAHRGQYVDDWEDQLVSAVRDLYELSKKNGDSAKEAQAFHALHEASMAMDPSGKPRKRGLFNGSLFARSHPNPSERGTACKRNYVVYRTRLGLY